MKPVLLLAALSLAVGCASPHRPSLLETDRQFSAYSVAHNAPAAFDAYMAENALSLPAGDEPITGKQAIVESLAPLKAGTLAWTPRQEVISRSGDLGYTWGTYEYWTTATNGQSRVSYGKYVTIWRKQPDGSWKAILDTGNQSPPPK